MASFDTTGQYAPQQVHYTYQNAYQVPPVAAPEQVVQDSFDTQTIEGPRVPFIGRVVTAAGAIGSLALVVGIGIWGYKLVARDVSGVPVVRAVEGPMRIQPADPGGQPADHQGLAVNTVAAEGTAAPPPDKLYLAPKPVSLSEEDVPMGEMKPVKASLTVDEAMPISDDAVAAFRDGSVDQLVAELIAEEEPQQTFLEGENGEKIAAIVQPEPMPAIDPADLVQQQPAPALLDAPGVKRSPRPQLRPARATPSGITNRTTVEAAVAAAVDTAAALDVDAATLPVGTRLAQLGAYDTPDIARAEWDRINARFADYMDGKQRVIQKAASGGRTFYRLRAMGFDDLSDARRFCAALVAERADCIPVTTR
ncbi:SPOR domain-containing protein [Lutimaribacter marinistellae]|uniref:SPOR domain-containing protein n=1 Tax=Lutimaribacter marinistellae TaxID=1820329 RepID=A0ABV7TJV7_9RHOB